MAEHFQYQALRGNEIRVLRVDPPRPGDDIFAPMKISLKHMDPLGQRPRLPFWALSYVWGSTDNQKTVYINGAPFKVTVNLYAALVQYRRQLLGSQRRNEAGVDVLWVDAICINQADTSEKSLQVPRMTEIYGRCERVLAWLGPVAGPKDEADVTILADTLPLLDNGASGYRLEEAPHWAMLQTRVRRALALLGMRPWFHRVWILQEFVLSAKPPVLLCGRYTIDFCAFIAAWNRLVWQTLVSRGTPPHFQWIASPNAYSEIKADRARREVEGHAGIASELLTLLDRANKLRATKEHDQVYALLGLVSNPQALPLSLAPDYRKPFAKVYHEYMAFLLRETGDTRIFLFGPLGTIPGIPSWVPDLRNRLTLEVAPGNPPQTHISLSPDSKTLAISAIPLGQVAHAFPSQGQLARRDTDTQIRARSLEMFARIGLPLGDPVSLLLTVEQGLSRHPGSFPSADHSADPTNLLFGEQENFPVSAFDAFEQAIIAPAAEIRQARFEDVLQTWQRFRLARLFGDRWQLVEPSFKIAYAAMRKGTYRAIVPDEFPFGPAALESFNVYRTLRLASVQDMFLSSPQFTLSNGQTGHVPPPPGESPMPTCEVGDLVVIFSKCEGVPFLIRKCDEGRYKLVSSLALDQYPQGLVADREMVEGFRRSFDMEARGNHPEHPVTKLEII